MHRRHFIQNIFGSLLLTNISPLFANSINYSNLKIPTLSQKIFRRMSNHAYKNALFEGTWDVTSFEGEIPTYISGKLIKIGPGTKEFAGTKFNHFFDGDAYLSEFSIQNGSISVRSQFLNTPHRQVEQLAQKMLFHEFGTQSPHKDHQGRKNQPNINFFKWDGSLLALSEGAHPVAFDENTLEFKSVYNFRDTLPGNISFTAHPKFDDKTGDGYAFGTVQGITKALSVFKLNSKTHEIEILYKLNQKHVFMIHDMIVTEKFIIFIIPPAYFKITDIILGKKPLSEALEFDQSEKTRLLILSKDKKLKPIEIEFDSYLVFHHGNAYEENNTITLQTFLAIDSSILKLINNWQADTVIKADLPALYEIKIDIKQKKLVSFSKILSDHDFPVYNRTYQTKKNRFLYAASMGNKLDPMAFDGISKIDFLTNKKITFQMKNDEMCSEPFFIPKLDELHEDSGIIAYLGYNQSKNESFLEFLKAESLIPVGRAWLGKYLPLGFHGHFQTA